MSVIHERLSLEQMHTMHRVLLRALHQHGLLKGRKTGIDPQDTKAVRRFDKKRPGRKTSNADWHNPHDPAAKVGRTKDGACDMV